MLELYASATLLGTRCNAQNKEYLLCKASAGSRPESCLAQGEAVTACGDTLIARLKESCSPEFEAFRSCLAKTNNAFDKCAEHKNALHAAVAAAKI